MDIEIRSKSVIISGYVNAVERDSRILPASMCAEATNPFVEQVEAGAFQRAIDKAADVRLKFNHQRDIGSVSGKTLTLKEDSIGLHASAEVTDPEVVEAARKKELRGWSFAFVNPVSQWESYREGVSRRKLKNFDLLEVSILTKTPAYIGTSVELRGEECHCTERRGCEDEPKITEEHKGIPPYEAAIEVMKLKNQL